MKRLLFAIVICAAVFAPFFIFAQEQEEVDPLDIQLSLPFRRGETITYDIRKMGISVGEAKLVFHGLTEADNGKRVFQVSFTAKGFQFTDVERIYLDPKTFYPVAIERDVNFFGKKEQIIETYDAAGNVHIKKYHVESVTEDIKQKADAGKRKVTEKQDTTLGTYERTIEEPAGPGIVKIKKYSGKAVEEQTISKENRLENIYGFLYRCRFSGTFELGEQMQVSLPTKDLTLRLIKTVKLQLEKENFDTYYLQSKPKQYQIWFDAGEKKIPLRIDGAVGFGKTSMVMKSYASL